MKREIRSYGFGALSALVVVLMMGAVQPAGRTCVGVAAIKVPRDEGDYLVFRAFDDGTIEMRRGSQRSNVVGGDTLEWSDWLMR